ncbi:ATP-dependent helicase [Mycoplasmopsis columbina]|uniref:ATP-dependent helicase n=1 Tax=Mycoplasmopsis columbina TaxID=114881 RepID=UPI0004A74C11|nr:UvrD-helicase domain-containing protein [Mycoplasmopsis columbina]VEU76959.1 ATP-dependent DNA helicase UvrD/PcrA [Mycoplasmopsis columbina]
MSRRERILKDLNEDQEKALNYFDGPLRIIAGAGSGKTRVLTRKIAYLINCLAIAPSEILAVTFTNKAANEMNERVMQYSNIDPQNTTVEKPEICTFHALCAKILRKEAHFLGFKNDFQIVDETDKKTILNNIYKNHNLSTQEVKYTRLINLFSMAKNSNFTSDELVSELNQRDNDLASRDSNKLIGQMFDEYNAFLKEKNCFDFDDLIIKVNELFNSIPDVADFWANKYSYILVDEFQDTSKLQYEIIKKLSSKNAQLTIVGDPDQTIYSWRGADVNLILDFDKDFPNTETVILKTNYRSSQKILNAANSLIKYNKKRFSKDLVTDNNLGEEIEFNHAFSPEAEARWVVQKINELKKKKIQLKNIAIFYRSNYYSRPFEQELEKEGINYKVFNGQKFFQRKEIKDALSYLRVIYDFSDVSLIRIINTPARKIGDATLAKLEAFAESKNTNLLDALITHTKELPVTNTVRNEIIKLLNSINRHHKALKKYSIHETLNSLLKDVEYSAYIKNDPTLKGVGEDNIKELLSSIKTWEKNNNPLGKGIKEYLEEISLFSAGDEYEMGTNYVTLMTVHSAKGLEFENVFLVGMNDKIFPHRRSLSSNNPEILEEERRLAYVAITRAKERLFISDSRGFFLDTNEPKVPSFFIKEMGIDLDNKILQNQEVTLDFSIIPEEQIKEINKNIIPGDIIGHTLFGEGTVLEVDQDKIRVQFAGKIGIKTLSKNHNAVRLLSANKED